MKERIPVYSKLGKDDLTKQSFKDSTDINKIVARAIKTGMMPVTDRKPIYGDFSKVECLQDVYEYGIRVNELYNSLPLSVKEKVKSVDELIKYVDSGLTEDKLKELGLIKDEPKKEEPKEEPKKDK